MLSKIYYQCSVTPVYKYCLVLLSCICLLFQCYILQQLLSASLLTAGCPSHGMPGTCCCLPSVLTETLLQSLDLLDASKKRLFSHNNKLTKFSRFLVFFYIFITGILQVLEPNRHFAFKRDSEACDGFVTNIDTLLY